MLEVLGASHDGRLEAYAVLTIWPGHTTVVDFQCPEPDAGVALLQYLVTRNYPRPYVFSFVHDPSPASGVLAAADFAVTKRFTALSLDLAAPPRHVLPISAGVPSPSDG